MNIGVTNRGPNGRPLAAGPWRGATADVCAAPVGALLDASKASVLCVLVAPHMDRGKQSSESAQAACQNIAGGLLIR
jgi:hypothetical protein